MSIFRSNPTAVLAILLLFIGCSTVPKYFKPVDSIAPKDFSHQAFDEILRAHVVNGVVNYPGIAADSKFEAYLQDINHVDPNGLPTRQDRLAFWINAYRGDRTLLLRGRRLEHPQEAPTGACDYRLEISAIFDWYKSDFVNDVRKVREIRQGGLVDYLRLYAPPGLAKELEGKTLSFLEYDWSLNQQ